MAVEYSGYLTILFNDISARESADPALNRYLVTWELLRNERNWVPQKGFLEQWA